MEVSPISLSTRSTGNTKVDLALNDVSNIRGRQWCFTLNNWSEVELVSLTQWVEEVGAKYIFAKEVGESGTPHIQGYIHFKNQTYGRTCKSKCYRAHWAKCATKRGKLTEEQIQMNNLIYCSKEGNYTTNLFVPKTLKVLSRAQLYWWQAFIEDMVCGKEADDRTVWWFWDKNGCKGKTAFMKYLAHNYEYVTWSACTKSADIVMKANVIKCVYLLNFVRAQKNFEPWIAIEQLKDGMVSDAKLKKESRDVMMNSPWVICFCNSEPDFEMLSLDRWRVVDIENRTLGVFFNGDFIKMDMV